MKIFHSYVEYFVLLFIHILCLTLAGHPYLVTLITREDWASHIVKSAVSESLLSTLRWIKVSQVWVLRESLEVLLFILRTGLFAASVVAITA